MLSFVLPLLGLAIVLTPVIVSARVAYRQEMAEQHTCVEASEFVKANVHNCVD